MNKKICALILCIIPTFILTQESEVMKSREKLLHDYVLMYPQLDEGFDIIHDIYKSDTTFYQFLDTHVPANSESDLGSLEKIHDLSIFGDVIYQAEYRIFTYMKPRFLKEVGYLLCEIPPKIDNSPNPAFRYVMKHRHGFMKLVVAKWVNGKDLFKPDHEILTTKVSLLDRYEMQGNEDLSADRTITFKKLIENTNKPKTLLSFAVQKNNEKMLRLLIQLGADMNDYYGMYERPLHNAVLYDKGKVSVSGQYIVSSDSSMVAILLELGADYDVQNGAGETSLYTAVKFNQIDVVELLLNKGANPNLVDNAGRSPLDIATSLHRNSIIKVLLDAGANINIKNQRGLTPLMLAVFFNNTEAVKILVAAGADANIIDNQGNTAMGMSRTRQMRNLISNRDNQSMCIIS